MSNIEYGHDVDPEVYKDMKPWEICYAGINSSDLGFVVGHYSKPIAPSMTRSAVDIPGRFGDLYLGTSYGAKTFNIPITIIAEDSEDYYRIHKNISVALIDPFEQPGMVYPIVFGDDPDKAEYYGHFSQIPDPTFVADNVWVANTTLTFVCADPKGYLPERDIEITQPVQNIDVLGNSEAYPIIHATVKKPIEHFGYVKDGEYVAIGKEKDFDTDNPNYIQNNEPLSFHDPCSSLANFTVKNPETFNLINGTFGGSLKASGDSGIVLAPRDAKNPNNGHRDFGKSSRTGVWHGPVMIHDAATNATPDWEVAFRLRHKGFYSRSMGKIEVYLLDPDGNKRGRFSIKDMAGGVRPGCLLEFTKDDGVRHYFLGSEAHPWTGPDKYKTNKPYHKVVLTTKEKKPYTVYKKSGRRTVKKTEYKWQTVKKTQLDDYDDTGVFSDFYGIVRIRKVGKKITWSVTKCEGGAWDAPMDVLTKGTWNMTDSELKSFGFSLSTVAVYMAKMDISEDAWNPVKDYHETYMAFTDLCIWNILDGGNDKNKPRYILQPGDKLIIDTERKHTYKNGIPFDYETAFGSTYPTWNSERNEQGSVEVAFDPPPGDKIDIGITYRPTVQ